MKIKCTACGAILQLPSSKDGAKVRCPSCEHVFVAHELGARTGRKKGSPTPWILGGGAAVGVLAIVYIANQPDQMPRRALQEEEDVVQAAEVADRTSWRSPAVKAARDVHEAAFAQDVTRLGRTIAFEDAYAWRRAVSIDEGGLGADAPAWSELSRDDQVEFQETTLADLVEGEGAELVAAWKPYDGSVVDFDEGDAIARLQVTPRDPELGVETRWVEWRLIEDDDGRWRAASWERWISPEEEKARRIAKSKLTQRVELSDGSIVIEGDVTALGHLPDTPPELRQRIDELYRTMIDLDISPRDADRALAEIIEIGRPAIPILLTGFDEIPLETEEEAIQVNLIVRALRDITGQYFGYKPQVVEGSGTGTSAERRASALKQWFGWWYRKGEKFTAKEQGEDLFDQSVIPTPREKRMMERFEKEKPD